MHLTKFRDNGSGKKPTITKGMRDRWDAEWVAHCRWLKSLGLPKITLEQYIDEKHGKLPKAAKIKVKTQLTVTPTRQTPHYPSKGDGVGNALVGQQKVYTGTAIVGISTMHKSNSVPVFSKEAAIDIAKMRRG